MKIEKVSENQIRCTLTKEDLADREIKLSELAYGTEKAKSLFRDMMQQASYELGFEAEDIPLMIEAIPLSDSIVLVITKVEDPEELDTRFSKFAPSIHSEDSESDDSTEVLSGADSILDLFRKIHENRKSSEENPGQTISGDVTPYQEKETEDVPNISLEPVSITKLFSFDSLDEIIRLSHVLDGFYEGNNSLFKDGSAPSYQLLLEQGDHSPQDFNKICNMASEYGHESSYNSSLGSFLREHEEVMIEGHALQSLSEMY